VYQDASVELQQPGCVSMMLTTRALVCSVVVVDGATEVLLRPKDWPSLWSLN
jgi:hypothetical protein